MQQQQQHSNVDYSDTYTVSVNREKVTDSWGLRIQGGSDLNEPIAVKQVRRKGPASKAGVKQGDLLSFIDNESTNGWTRQQISDILAGPRLTIQLKLTRQTPGLQSAISHHVDINEHRRHREPVATPVFSASEKTIDETTSETKRQAALNLAHRVQPQQPVKGYQPFDFLGTSGSSNISPPQRVVHQVAASGLQHNASVQPAAETSETSPVYSQPAVRHVDASYDKPLRFRRLKREEPQDTDVPDGDDNWRPIRQSRSFLLIETALAVQGAGENGLPPPRSATFEYEHAVQRHNQLQTEWL